MTIFFTLQIARIPDFSGSRVVVRSVLPVFQVFFTTSDADSRHFAQLWFAVISAPYGLNLSR